MGIRVVLSSILWGACFLVHDAGVHGLLVWAGIVLCSLVLFSWWPTVLISQTCRRVSNRRPDERFNCFDGTFCHPIPLWEKWTVDELLNPAGLHEWVEVIGLTSHHSPHKSAVLTGLEAYKSGRKQRCTEENEFTLELRSCHKVDNTVKFVNRLHYIWLSGFPRFLSGCRIDPNCPVETFCCVKTLPLHQLNI